MGEKATIEELQAILREPDGGNRIHLNPDGSLTTTRTEIGQFFDKLEADLRAAREKTEFWETHCAASIAERDEARAEIRKIHDALPDHAHCYEGCITNAIDALQQECERLKRECGVIHGLRNDAETRSEALQVRVGELEKDKERLDWLGDQQWEYDERADRFYLWLPLGDPSDDRLRRAVDAARAEAGKG